MAGGGSVCSLTTVQWGTTARLSCTYYLPFRIKAVKRVASLGLYFAGNSVVMRILHNPRHDPYWLQSKPKIGNDANVNINVRDPPPALPQLADTPYGAQTCP